MLKLVGNPVHQAAVLAVACVLAASISTSAAAFDPSFWHRQGFLGLWKGVDSLDGSTVLVSITDVEHDGVLEINQTEGFFTTCAEMGADFSFGRGKVLGTGTVASKSELETTTTLTCINNDGDQPGVSLEPFDSTYTLKSHGRILALPEFNETPGILVHRIAK